MKIFNMNKCQVLAVSVLGAWLVLAGFMLVTGFAILTKTYADTDNAMRMVEMRQYLSGQSSWYDMLIPRVQPPDGLLSHWSRLIDFGQATMVGALTPLIGIMSAELWMRALWPVIWLLPVLAAMVLIAVRLAGLKAGFITLIVIYPPTITFQRFMPGNIDHHNVQIALATTAIAATIWADKSRFAAILAGVLTGLMLAIGLETAIYVCLVISIFGLRFIIHSGQATRLTAFGAALVVVTFGALISALPPSHWGEYHCDAIALNIAVPVMLAGGIMMLCGIFDSRLPHWQSRFAVMVVAGMMAGATFYLMDPNCIKGPFADIDPRIIAAWLGGVNEAQPWLKMLHNTPYNAIIVGSYPFVILGVVIASLICTRTTQDAWLVATFSLVAACVLMLQMVRAESYASVFAVPIAIAIATKIIAHFKLRSPLVQYGIYITTMPAFAMVLALGIMSALNMKSETPDAGKSKTLGCLSKEAITPLQQVPPGLIITSINLGPSILARTQHSVVSAPYHRLSNGILQSYAVLRGPVAGAYDAVIASGADYLAYCQPGVKDDKPTVVKTLSDQLQAQHPPAWLTPIMLQYPEPKSDQKLAQKPARLLLYHIKPRSIN